MREYKEAQSLGEVDNFEPEQIKQIAASLLEVLVYLQNLTPPVIHRNIKPENILVDDQFNIYLVDFGFAYIGDRGKIKNSIAGTPGFMAREQLRNRQLTKATDLYALGATLNEQFKADLDFMLREAVVDNSEYAICENLIYPVLKEVWRDYSKYFVLWSHQTLYYNDDLSGLPDYTLAKRSPLGKVIFDKPFIVLVEAKKDNFEEGWGQCLAEMVAAREINQIPGFTVFGIVSNGDNWEFGKLQDNNFVKELTIYNISDLPKLFGALYEVFEASKQQLEKK